MSLRSMFFNPTSTTTCGPMSPVYTWPKLPDQPQLSDLDMNDAGTQASMKQWFDDDDDY